MPSLRDFQAAFAGGLRTGDWAGVVDAVAGDPGEAAQRLEIHRRHVRHSLTRALRDNFPAVSALVGERFFDFAAASFALANPPRSPCLAEYGADLPAFLAAMPACAGLPYLGDVARLEWLIHEAALAPDPPALDRERLRDLSEDAAVDARLRLHPRIRFLTAGHPVDLVYDAARAGLADGELRLPEGAIHLEVHAGAMEVRVRRLSDGRSAFRRALASGRTLGDAWRVAAAADPGFALAAELSQLIDAGAVTAILTGPFDSQEIES